MSQAQRFHLWTPDYLRIFLCNLLLMVVSNMLPSVFGLFLLSRGGTDMQVGLATYLYSFPLCLCGRWLAGFLTTRAAALW